MIASNEQTNAARFTLGDLFAPAARLFGYDAAAGGNKRRAPKTRLGAEEMDLRPSERRRLVATARDLPRNIGIAAWAIRKHLDFVASHSFQVRAADRGLAREVEGWVGDWSGAGRSDAAGRHDLLAAVRLAEARAVVDGDVFALLLRDGSVQWIEGDRVRKRTDTDKTGRAMAAGAAGSDPADYGVRVNKRGRAVAYAIHKRTGAGQFEFEREAPARWCLQHGYFDRFDQVRGVSPLAPSINSLIDVYENFDYALAKAKVSQLFALAFFRDAAEAIGDVENTGGDDTPEYQVDFGKGPAVLDLAPGDRAEFLSVDTPGGQFQEFTKQLIGVSIKALDLPVSFWDESHTNFFGSRSALILYLKSAQAKRRNLQKLLNRITGWRLGLAVARGELALPAGVTIADLSWRWIPDGVPWWDPAKEIKGDVMAVAAGLRTRREIRAERYGDDWDDVIAGLAEEEAIIRGSGVTITEAAPDIFNASEGENDQ